MTTVPFDQEGERRNPWWGDPTYRTIPQGTTEGEVKLYHMHIDPRFGQEDLDVVLPMRRLGELASEGVIGRPAHTHHSIMQQGRIPRRRSGVNARNRCAVNLGGGV
jgi:hypothetical protein